MGLKEIKYYTISCDIPKCPETLTAPDEDMLVDKGWSSYPEDLEKKLCPAHAKELEEFLYGKDKS